MIGRDLMDCPSCQRRTPAARVMCIYCGATLPVTRIESAPPQRPIENFELAFNAILEPSPSAGEREEVALASALNIESSEARALISAHKRVPIARAQTRHEAELIAALIRTCGLKASVIPDQDFRLDVELIRARRVTIANGELLVHAAGSTHLISASEVKLMVVGRLRSNRIDYTEGISGSDVGSLLDSFEFTSEAIMLDVYTSALERSFRIRAEAFDYSGLRGRLAFRTEENFQALLAAMAEAAPQAKLDEDFARLERLLARAWPERTKIEPRGFKRAGISRRTVAQSSILSDNRDQFDRYSRLMFLSV